MKRWGIILVAALIVAAFLSPFASPHPDGLERVAEDLAFSENGQLPAVRFSPMPDYTITVIHSEKVSTALAGIVGTLLTLVFTYGWTRILSKLP
ncbi:PDGLE domain-containing protein [Thermosediminibacter litoriperuensis]|uniref:Cobalt/nickel transport protein n=1 Tax=Thermosediminibacter litoriperuensis TaxID=291989 RepID=A0A5S5AYL6_9FIRM|nr:PDGLE domain-containing protein [Thermosediminibacter litoriperuensis]TYP57876.1 cobalt/nickel transport protein [Thermosediminibacter litoriperuensis]